MGCGRLMCVCRRIDRDTVDVKKEMRKWVAKLDLIFLKVNRKNEERDRK